MITLNDVITRIVAEVQSTYEEVYGPYVKTADKERYSPYGVNGMSGHDFEKSVEAAGYNRAMKTVEKAVNEIIRDEIKAAKLDFIL